MFRLFERIRRRIGLKLSCRGVRPRSRLDMIQGYLISRPIAAAELAELLPRSYARAA